MLTNKSISFCVLHVLQEYSDTEHILQMNEILSHLKAGYDLSADRRTIYGAMEALCLMGYDISTFEENGKGYFLRSRAFEPSEVRLLTDRVYFLGYISKRQTEDLLQKLQSTQSVHQRKKYHHLKVARARKKTPNAEIFLNVELLDEAIDHGVQVEFDYMQYGLDKKLVPRRDKSYLVNPYVARHAKRELHQTKRDFAFTKIHKEAKLKKQCRRFIQSLYSSLRQKLKVMQAIASIKMGQYFTNPFYLHNE